jgi:NAD-reducing hydrogenase large subunit
MKRAAKRITIRPVTRIEGHARVDILLDERGRVKDAYFRVEELRGFEKFLQGRKVWELPRITPRICGICPVSHHLASAKACDNLFGVEPPATARLLRELMHMGQLIHSHSLHFFFLAAPDFLLAERGPAVRNVLGLVKADPELAKQAIRLRGIGQDIIQLTGGKAIHPVTALPGGMSKPLTKEELTRIEKSLKKASQLAEVAVDILKKLIEANLSLIRTFADIQTGYMGLVREGKLELYDGRVRIVDARGKRLEEFDPPAYLNHIGEHVVDWSYLKFPFYKRLGWPDGIYRAGPLARLNVCDGISTPRANEMLSEFRQLLGHPASPTLAYHYARLIELVYAIERAQELVGDERIGGTSLRADFELGAGQGVGVVEAPRGTLYHHYVVDEKGNVERVNLIVATVHNNPGINLSVKEAVRQLIHGRQIDELVLNKVEMAIRAYDPCLSCATHTIGQMPIKLTVYDSQGEPIGQLTRDGQ